MDILVNKVQTLLRAAFTRQEVTDVQVYGGDFSAEEVGRLSFACPALLVASAGWANGYKPKRLTGIGIRGVRLAVFIVTDDKDRATRMSQACVLAERVALALESWAPGDDPAYIVAPIEVDTLRAENLYGPAVDKKGLALWCVDWIQATRIKPHIDPAKLFDLRAVEITDTIRHTAPDTTPPPPADPLVVTQDVQFAPVPPPQP